MKLLNTLYKLTCEKQLRVAYFGGSITEGGDALGWRGRTTAWLQETWPEACITEIQAAIGGTGSDLGAYRCDHDVIAHKPDLTFIEFAVNDYSTKPELVRRNIEACVRKIMRANPQGEIMFVYTSTKAISDHLAEGTPFLAREIDEEIARYYGWPSVDIGTPLVEAVARENGDWLKYTNDTVHPNAQGYAFCAQAVIDALSELLKGDALSVQVGYSLPNPMTSDAPENAQLCDALPLCAQSAQPDADAVQDWTKLAMTLSNRWPSAIGANKPGAVLEIPFSGTAIGLYYMIARDSGIAEWQIDGSDWHTLNTFDHYALSFDRAAFRVLADDLSQGEHTLTLRVANEKDERSNGYWLRLGAYGIC